ncbi:bacteriohemerythrin [Solirhodobacter olei]|uniref:bacteriohemerythrin n=1 Tax=Solirhodobacter olei TaxID=2493082 RepID=UPI000FDBCE1D|nr:hemerythrin domain-containing protein [Solirhodobacter olei]
MELRQELRTGFAHIDAQHKALLEAVDCFRDTLKNGESSRPYEAFLGFLTIYGMVHFQIEESCMQAHRCAAANQNCLEHKAFRKMIEAECARFYRQGFDPELARALLGRIDRWLSRHMGQVDVQLRKEHPI